MTNLQEKHIQAAAEYSARYEKAVEALKPFAERGSESAAETMQMLEVMAATFRVTEPTDAELYMESLELMQEALAESENIIEQLHRAALAGAHRADQGAFKAVRNPLSY